ncbi:hypothetical protein NE686_00595 [Tissierella carlieri]|uniref:Uncharacterized protein n=1 Tax=Tissierella carlieri TaxID=689904 RepID=A0ABT1S522_9FIRM|nr:hypothetical protein [Tissierella carlieri]MCQ4921567.1 hypothetical protein [Tissierella carlieri]
MAIRSGFYNSVNGDRKYDAKNFAEYFASFIGSGVFPNPSNSLQVMANNDMTVTVKAGKAWINGYILINDDDHILNIDVADGALNRIDRVVLRWDAADREIRIEVKKGTFASNPVAHSLQRDADAYEIAIADIRINKGAVSITQANIVDLRLNNELCGIVHGTVNQVDTTTLFNQYQDWINQKKGEFDTDLIDYTDIKKQEFEDWVNSIQDILDENIAGNLLQMIGDIEQLKTGDKSNLVSAVNELFTSVSDGKQLIATAITDKGILTNSSDTFQTMATNISNIESRYSTFELVTLYGFDPIIALNHYIRRQ